MSHLLALSLVSLVYGSPIISKVEPGPQLTLSTCKASASQKFSITPNQTTLFVTTPSGPMCVDIRGFDTNPGAVVYTFPCGEGSKRNQDFVVGAESIKSMQTPPTCLVAANNFFGSKITTAKCSGSDPLQKLSFSSASGSITLAGTAFCVDADGPSPLPPSAWCGVSPQSTWAICDPAQSLDARVADLVSRLSLDDKIAALVTRTVPLTSVGLPAYEWWSEGTHGISGPGVQHNATYPGASNTALPITTSCSFNRSLWKETGNLIGREGRAFWNAGLATGATFWTPVLNIVRDPRWGEWLIARAKLYHPPPSLLSS